MIANLGWATFLLFAIVDAFSALFSWFFIRETMGRSLEEMETEFNSEAAGLAARAEYENQNESGASSSHSGKI